MFVALHRGAAKKEDTINPGFPQPVHSSVQPSCLFLRARCYAKQSKQGNDETDMIPVPKKFIIP